jgi:hypothetical protein
MAPAKIRSLYSSEGCITRWEQPTIDHAVVAPENRSIAELRESGMVAFE